MNKILEQEASSLEVLSSNEEIKQAMWDSESSKALDQMVTISILLRNVDI